MTLLEKVFGSRENACKFFVKDMLSVLESRQNALEKQEKTSLALCKGSRGKWSAIKRFEKISKNFGFRYPRGSWDIVVNIPTPSIAELRENPARLTRNTVRSANAFLEIYLWLDSSFYRQIDNFIENRFPSWQNTEGCEYKVFQRILRGELSYHIINSLDEPEYHI